MNTKTSWVLCLIILDLVFLYICEFGIDQIYLLTEFMQKTFHFFYLQIQDWVGEFFMLQKEFFHLFSFYPKQ